MEKIIHDLDKPKAEVLIDVLVLEDKPGRKSAHALCRDGECGKRHPGAGA